MKPDTTNQKAINTEKDSFKHRPLSVTIVAILVIIDGILCIIVGLALVAGFAIAPEITTFLGFGVIVVAIGIAYLVLSYGVLKGKGKAWSITLIVSYITIVTSISGTAGGDISSIYQLIVSIAIVYLLHRPQAKAFFGKPPDARI